MAASAAFRWNPSQSQREIFEEWKAYTLNFLVSCREGTNVRSIPSYLMEMVGEEAPLEKMGFKTTNINHFLYAMKECLEIGKIDRRLFIFIRESAVPSCSSHVRRDVLQQAKDKSCKTRTGVIKKPTKSQCSHCRMEELLTAGPYRPTTVSISSSSPSTGPRSSYFSRSQNRPRTPHPPRFGSKPMNNIQQSTQSRRSSIQSSSFSRPSASVPLRSSSTGNFSRDVNISGPVSSTTRSTIASSTTRPVLTVASSTTRPVLTVASSTTRPVLTVVSSTTKPAPTSVSSTTKPAPTSVSSTTKPVPTVASSTTRPVLTVASSTTRPVLTVVSSTTKPAPTSVSSTTKPVITITSLTTRPVLTVVPLTTRPVLTAASLTTRPVLTTVSSTTKPDGSTTLTTIKSAHEGLSLSSKSLEPTRYRALYQLDVDDEYSDDSENFHQFSSSALPPKSKSTKLVEDFYTSIIATGITDITNISNNSKPDVSTIAMKYSKSEPTKTGAKASSAPALKSAVTKATGHLTSSSFFARPDKNSTTTSTIKVEALSASSTKTVTHPPKAKSYSLARASNSKPLRGFTLESENMLFPYQSSMNPVDNYVTVGIMLDSRKIKFPPVLYGGCKANLSLKAFLASM